MQINYTFQGELEDVHVFTVQLDDGRIVEVYDQGTIKVYDSQGELRGESHVDFAVPLAE